MVVLLLHTVPNTLIESAMQADGVHVKQVSGLLHLVSRSLAIIFISMICNTQNKHAMHSHKQCNILC